MYRLGLRQGEAQCAAGGEDAQAVDRLIGCSLIDLKVFPDRRSLILRLGAFGYLERHLREGIVKDFRTNAKRYIPTDDYLPQLFAAPKSRIPDRGNSAWNTDALQ